METDTPHLLLAPSHRQVIEGHSARVYPEECCGLLLGRSAGGERRAGRVARVIAARNGHLVRDRHHRYVIPPRTVADALRQARATGQDLLGFYHSHPDGPARPSELDHEAAWPGRSYVVVSVSAGRVVELRSWRLSEDRARFVEETITGGGR